MLYEGNLIDAFVEGAMHYIGSIVVTTVFYTYAFNKWVINPGRRTGEPVEG